MHLVSFEHLETLQHSARSRAARLGRQGQNRSGSPAGRAVTQLEPRRLGDEVLGFEALEPGRRGSQRIGAVLQSGPRAGWVVDLNRALAIKLACNDVGAPEPVADSLVPANMAGFLREGASAVSAAHVALDFANQALRDYDAPDILRAGAVEREVQGRRRDGAPDRRHVERLVGSALRRGGRALFAADRHRPAHAGFDLQPDGRADIAGGPARGRSVRQGPT